LSWRTPSARSETEDAGSPPILGAGVATARVEEGTMVSSPVAAKLAAIVLVGVAVFQLLLAAGVPWGHYAWGGAHEVLPTRLRIASLVAIPIYALAAAIILSRAGVVRIITNTRVTHLGSWVLVVVFGIGAILNALSRSERERLMVPVVVLLSLLCLVVARSKPR
jgi:hypothetical protein